MKPYYQDEWVQIFHGDCREILPQLPDNSVDLVLTSPPFNQSWCGKHHTGSQWEKHYEDNLPEGIYQQQQIDILNILWGIVRFGTSTKTAYATAYQSHLINGY